LPEEQAEEVKEPEVINPASVQPEVEE